MNIKLFFINYAYNIQIMSKSRFELWSRNIARKDEMIDMLIEAYQSTSCHTPFFEVKTCSNTSKVFHYPSSFNHIETSFSNISNSIFCGILKGLNKHLHIIRIYFDLTVHFSFRLVFACFYLKYMTSLRIIDIILLDSP